MNKTIKKIMIFISIIAINFTLSYSFAQQGGGQTPSLGGTLNSFSFSDIPIYNHDRGKIIDENITDSENPLRMGSYRVSGEGEINGLVGVDSTNVINDYDTALQKILKVIQNIVNYALGILGVIALIYLIIHGLMILTAAGDDSKTKKGLKGIKNAFIAIAGIGLSWIIISFILRLINTLTS